jgi:hypothetical protein
MKTLFDARYLEAKRTVDDRALNKDVVERLRGELAARGVHRQKVLEVGAGIGTMLTRLIEWRVLQHADYTLLDQDSELLQIGRRRLLDWAAAHGCAVEELSDGLRLRAPDLDFTAHFLAGELHSLLSSSAGPNDVDLLIANAFLDIVDLPWTLPRLLERAAQGGLYWFCINFDGESIFLPEHGDDAQLLQVYHRSMDERVRDGRRTGDSKTGRRLFSQLAQAGARVLAAGASDWVVYPTGAGYPADEAYFLGHILNTIEQELGSHAEIQASVLAAWTDARKRQLERGELHFIAHQLDYCGKVERPQDKRSG